MRHAVICQIRPGSLPALQAHRLKHLEYIQAHQDLIAFGWPTRGADGLPQTMIIVVKTDNQAEAEAFIEAEPYNASGQVFASVQVLPWSQVMPELEPGDLAKAIAQEQGASQAR